MNRCRCGRYDGPVVVNGVMHEGLEVEGGFCGPVVQHEVRDLRAQLVAAESALRLIKALGMHPMSTKPHPTKTNMVQYGCNGVRCATCIAAAALANGPEGS